VYGLQSSVIAHIPFIYVLTNKFRKTVVSSQGKSGEWLLHFVYLPQFSGLHFLLLQRFPSRKIRHILDRPLYIPPISPYVQHIGGESPIVPVMSASAEGVTVSRLSQEHHDMIPATQLTSSTSDRSKYLLQNCSSVRKICRNDLCGSGNCGGSANEATTRFCSPHCSTVAKYHIWHRN
jgi:hypothetical protein